MEEVRREAKRLRLFLLSPPLQHVTRSVDIGVGHHLTDFFSIPVEECRNQAICLLDSHRGCPRTRFLLIQ